MSSYHISVERITELLTPEQEAVVDGLTPGNIETFCALLGTNPPEVQRSVLVALANSLAQNPLFDEPTIEELIDCLERALGLSPNPAS